VLTGAQRALMKRVLEQEERNREHVVVYLSGAHAYGFPSPDSDLDLKTIHVAKTADLLGFEVPPPTFDRAEIVDGVEIDYTSNELAHALSGMLAGNGNFLVGLESALLEKWRPRIEALFTRLHAARQASVLPEEPRNEPEIREWLLRVRRSRFS
jgi:hypothetical protein